jgi:lantibiotic modifying enzyme
LFNAFRAEHAGGANAALLGALRVGRRRVYTAFVDHHLADGYAAIGRSYPVAARLLATQTAWWVDNTCALLERLESEWPEVRHALSVPDRDPLESLASIEVNLSDPHRKARTVSVLHFASGVRVVYKPRGLAVERCFQQLLAWVNDRSGGPALRTLVVLDYADHGWVEFAAPAGCTSLREVEAFYTRGGMLLCLAYVIGASDLHSGNVHACGDQPVIIDLEVLFSSLVSNGTALEDDPRRNILDSVLFTALSILARVRPSAAWLFGSRTPMRSRGARSSFSPTSARTCRS